MTTTLSDPVRNPKLKQAIADAGGYRALADRLGVSSASVWQWSERGQVPVQVAPAFEAECGLARPYLRPDDWHLIWPDLIPRFRRLVPKPAHPRVQGID